VYTFDETRHRLSGMSVPDEKLQKEWDRIVLLAGDSLIGTLDKALGTGSSGRDQTIIAGVSQGPSRFTNMVGKGGRLTPTATRYFHFLISVIDVVIRVQGPWREDIINYFGTVQRIYSSLRRDYGGKGGELSKKEIRMARTVILSALLNTRLRASDVDYFSDNYDTLEPYLDLIIQRKDMSENQIKALIETRPEPALAEGAL
jgi:hypothetical protein